MTFKKAKWLIESDVFDNEHTLTQALTDLGIKYKMTGHVRASGEMEDQKFSDDECVVYYGSLNLAQTIIKTRKFKLGVFGPIEHFNCDQYYPAFGKYLLNSDYTILPYGKLLAMKAELYEKHGSNGRIFIRPVSCLKEFSGMSATMDKYEEVVKLAGFYNVSDHLPVLVSSAKDIEIEWRFVAVEGKIITGSRYGQDDESYTLVEASHPAWILASGLCQLHQPSSAWVIDICQTSDGKYHMLECGCISFASLYGCDLNLVAKHISELAIRA